MTDHPTVPAAWRTPGLTPENIPLGPLYPTVQLTTDHGDHTVTRNGYIDPTSVHLDENNRLVCTVHVETLPGEQQPSELVTFASIGPSGFAPDTEQPSGTVAHTFALTGPAADRIAGPVSVGEEQP
ncbi:hypothetical protein [Nocardiopsis sp. FR26]|uniref:hypothetical protein n=1 Tax=Nocardiopsis sp. FR26 TaxID=2605987 RepID=UPI00135AA00A|nr:hypothetical protein [Nocardiopsis sp. FR26]